MWKRGIFVFPALGAVLLAACFGYAVRSEWETALRDRAPFELNCPVESITVVALTAETYGATDAPLYQGVEGCGQRNVYVATRSGYVLNSGSAGYVPGTHPPPPPPMPLPPPPAPR